jgi:uncharacterized membrane protein
MNTYNDKREAEVVLKNNRALDKLIKVLLIIGIIVISGIIIYFIFNPAPGYTTFGLLNSNKQAGNYQKTASVGENVTFHAIVGNFLGRDFRFYVEVLIGDNDTIRSETGSRNTTSAYNTSIFNLHHTETWMSDSLQVSFSQVGTNYSVIAELWEVTTGSGNEFKNIMWFIINITA